MKLHVKPEGVTMRSVFDDIWRIETAIYGEGFYHAGSHHTDPLFNGYAVRDEPHRYSVRPTQCTRCRRIHKLPTITGSGTMCRCGYSVVVSPFDCNSCGAKLGFCEHVVTGYTA